MSCRKLQSLEAEPSLLGLITLKAERVEAAGLQTWFLSRHAALGSSLARSLGVASV